MGDKGTRELPPGLGVSDLTFAGWDRRLRIGGNTGGFNGVNQMGTTTWSASTPTGPIVFAPGNCQRCRRALEGRGA